ncbi:MAG: protein-S-isoprenylcysteine methyltransferase [Gammaproteobacteria bacterium]|nr:MAG: protein-S-isoprenylcysteine methyltransferase [Gammaproteobacteria bacterium]
MHSLELKIPPVAQAIIIGALMVIAAKFLPRIDINPLLQWVSIGLLLLVGMYFGVAGIVEFRRQKTTVDPRYPGNASELVDTGIYRLSRNPMYVGIALLLVAIVLYFRSPFLLLGVVVFMAYMTRFQIMPEEAHLSKVFGAKYDDYKSRVRRWL